MTDSKSFFERCKEVFFARRSNSVPSYDIEEDESNEDVSSGLEQKKNTLRRSKSGRVKAMVRSRSLVSSYDFQRHDQEDEKMQDGRRQTLPGLDVTEEVEGLQLRHGIEKCQDGENSKG